jgi:hypothetical protein
MTANLTSASKTPGKTPGKLAAKPAVADIYPLTSLQKGLLFHALYEPESAAYFEQLCVRLDGALNHGAFEEAWRRLIDRHGILRSAFVTLASVIEAAWAIVLSRYAGAGLPH